MLLDTGSDATLFDADLLEDYGIRPDGADVIQDVVGIGGEESVVEKRIGALALGDIVVSPFTIQIGILSYRFGMNGILGADFLLQTGSVVDFKNLEIRKG